MICPICHKAGIEDNATICPQCDSDLSQYNLLTKLENKIRVRQKLKSFFLTGLTIIIIALVGVIIYIKSNYNIISTSNQNLLDTADSLSNYRQKYLTISQEIDSIRNISEKVYIDYKVKKGDNLSSLAFIFYDDSKKAEKIAIDNGLKNKDRIYVNQILIIEIIN